MTNHAQEGPLVDYADWIEQMKDADSLLTALTDDEIGAGVRALRALGDTDLGPLTLGLVAFRAATPSGAGCA